MKYQNANNYFLLITLWCSLLATFPALARIENTIIANYDLASGKNSHYELLVSHTGNTSTVTVVPVAMSNNTPSIFKVSTCINHYAGKSKQGEFRFTAAETDQNDMRLANIGYFVNEHNLGTWWIYLNDQQNLMFNEDFGGLMVSDPDSFNITDQMCPLD